MGIEQKVKRWAKRNGKDPISYWELNKWNILRRADSNGKLANYPSVKRHESPSDVRRRMRRNRLQAKQSQINDQWERDLPEASIGYWLQKMFDVELE